MIVAGLGEVSRGRDEVVEVESYEQALLARRFAQQLVISEPLERRLARRRDRVMAQRG